MQGPDKGRVTPVGWPWHGAGVLSERVVSFGVCSELLEEAGVVRRSVTCVADACGEGIGSNRSGLWAVERVDVAEGVGTQGVRGKG